MPPSARVVVLQRSLRRYREPFYKHLKARLQEAGVELEVLHSNPPEEEDSRRDAGHLPWAKHIPMRHFRVRHRQLLWQSALRHVRGADLVIVEQAAMLLLNPVLLVAQRLGGPRVAFWGHGANFDEESASSLGEGFKRQQSRRAHWWFAYTDEAAAVVGKLGFPPERVTVVHNSTDTRALSAAVSNLTRAALATIRKDFGLSPGPVAVFVGSLVEAKGLSLLLLAADRVVVRIPTFRLVIIGAGELEADLREAAQTRPWLHMTGTLFGDDLAAVLGAADTAVLPGWAGLSITDCFAAGLPVVISEGLPHPPEAAYVQDGINGVRVATDTPTDLADALVDLLTQDARLATLAAGALRTAQQFTVEAMSERFADGIVEALST